MDRSQLGKIMGRVTWGEFASAAPDLATFGAERLRQGVAFLATTRPDGGPRVHPLTPEFIDGRLFVFMEPTSPKGHDLRRDPRYCLHASVDPRGAGGEFLCRGKADTLTGEQRGFLGAKADNALDRFVLFELFIEQALRIVYVDKRPVRTLWTAEKGLKTWEGTQTL